MLDFLVSPAYAQAAPQAPNALLQFAPLVFLLVLFYFMLIRPQNKRAKEHREMVSALEVGTEIATAGGIVGKVTEVGESIVSVEIASGVVVKIQRNTIAQVLPKGTLKNS